MSSSSFGRYMMVCAVSAAAAGYSGIVSAQSESSGALWLGLGSGRSDNVRREAIAPESGSYSALLLESDFDYESSRLDVSFQADLERRNYSVTGVEDETYGNARLDAGFDAVPDRVSWLVLDRYSQGRIDPFDVTSPDNRAEINVFSTGPRFNLPIGMRSVFRIQALREERSVSDLEGLDSDSIDSALAYVRVLDSTTEVALNVTSQDIDYDLLGLEFETESAYFSYSKTLATGQAYLAVGTTRTKSMDGSSSTPYLNLSWSHDVGSRSRFEINAVQEYVDFFDDYRFGSSSETVPGENIYEQQLLAVSYAAEGERNTFSIRASATDVGYVMNSGDDYTDNELALDYRRAMARRTSIGVGYRFADRDYDFAAAQDSFDRWNVSFEKAVGRRFSLRAEYEMSDDERVGDGASIDENILRVSMRYAVTRSGSGANTP